MYYPIIRQFIQALKNLETWLDKAEQHAAAKGFDVGVLLTRADRHSVVVACET